MKSHLLVAVFGLTLSCVAASEGTLLTKTDALTEDTTYTYALASSGEESMTVICGPKGDIDFQICYTNSYYQRRCHLNYDYKLDDGPIEKKEWKYNKKLSDSYARTTAFLQKIISHDQMIIKAHEFSDAVVFDISDMSDKFSVFAHQCPVVSSSAAAPTLSTDNGNTTVPTSENLQPAVGNEAEIMEAYNKASKLYSSRECDEMNKVIKSTLDQYNGQSYLEASRPNFTFLQDNCS